MEFIDYAIGLGGWLTVLFLAAFYQYGVLNPAVAAVTPFVTICATYVVLLLLRLLLYIVVSVVQLMFRGDILLVAFTLFTTCMFVHTVMSTIIMLNRIEIDVD